MRKYLLFILLSGSLPFVLQSCGGGGDMGGSSSYYDDCEYYGCKKAQLGTIRLLDSSRAWLGDSTLTFITLVNDSGLSFDFAYKKEKTTVFDIPVNSRTETCSSGRTRKCNDDLEIEQQADVLSGNLLPLSIRVVRQKHTIGMPTTGIKRDSLPKLRDKLFIQIKDASFDLPVSADTLPPGVTFYPVLTLKGINYNNVYQCDNNASPTGVLKVKGIYHSLKSGFLGYYLSNGERWLRK